MFYTYEGSPNKQPCNTTKLGSYKHQSTSLNIVVTWVAASTRSTLQVPAVFASSMLSAYGHFLVRTQCVRSNATAELQEYLPSWWKRKSASTKGLTIS